MSLAGFKLKVHQEAAALLKTKIANLQDEIAELASGMRNDTKSSAGDKHETARAMAQLEQEKLQHQLAEYLQQEQQLLKNDPGENSDRVRNGSLVQCSNAWFYVCIPLGKVLSGKETVMLLSPQSPIGKLFLGKCPGEKVKFNQHEYLIMDVC